MIVATNIAGFLLWLATVGAFWQAYGDRRRLPPALRWPGFLAMLPLAFMMRGLLGEASLALPALAYIAGGAAGIGNLGRWVLGGLLFAGLTLYASALGFLEPDLYAIGYAPSWHLVAVVAMVLAGYCALPILAWSWLVGLGLFAARLHPSPNLWDALIDVPSVFLAAWLLWRRRPGARQDHSG